MAQDTEARRHEKRLTIICGANVEKLDGCFGLSIGEIKRRMGPVLNITDDHAIVLVNGREIKDPGTHLLEGNEELEFKKVAGQKG